MAYWDKFSQPAKRPDPLFSPGVSGWWIDPQKAKTIEASKTAEAGTTDAQAAPQPQQQVAAPATQPAAPAPTESAPADRGRSPIIYGAGAVAVVIAAFLVARRRRKS
jgi:hypothetical protein